MPSVESGFEIVQDDLLRGPASVVEEMSSADEDDVAAALEQRLQTLDVALPAARAGFLDEARRLIARLRGRQQVADLGTHEVAVELLRFHVPPGGRAGLTIEHASNHATDATVSFMGLGWGSGRKISMKAERDFGERQQCFVLGTNLAVRLRTFSESASHTADVLQVDVEQSLGSFLRAEAECPLCFTSLQHKSPRAKLTPHAWDLTQDEKGLTEKLTFEFTDESEFEVGLDIPVANLGAFKPALAMRRAFTSRFVASYHFPPHARFTGYELIGKRKDFPFWGKG